MGAGALWSPPLPRDDELITSMTSGADVNGAVGALGIVELNCLDEFAGVSLGSDDFAIGR